MIHLRPRSSSTDARHEPITESQKSFKNLTRVPATLRDELLNETNES